MVDVNPKWQIWMIKQQRYTGILMAVGTIIIAVVGILQAIKLYNFSVANWVLQTIVGIIMISVIIIIVIFLKRDFELF